MEEQLISKIEKGIHRIKKGTSTPLSEGLGKAFNQLKELNIGMYEELLNNYKAVLTIKY